ncbi:hypothetical protein HanPI659440_Chr08g0296701 [Helianthus annuus]|nr:hypothetical protein HanPI659440_Chr08g0296701 [Helianthus annuus]
MQVAETNLLENGDPRATRRTKMDGARYAATVAVNDIGIRMKIKRLTRTEHTINEASAFEFKPCYQK